MFPWFANDFPWCWMMWYHVHTLSYLDMSMYYSLSYFSYFDFFSDNCATDALLGPKNRPSCVAYNSEPWIFYAASWWAVANFQKRIASIPLHSGVHLSHVFTRRSSGKKSLFAARRSKNNTSPKWFSRSKTPAKVNSGDILRWLNYLMEFFMTMFQPGFPVPGWFAEIPRSKYHPNLWRTAIAVHPHFSQHLQS